ncbi:proton-conducting transporter membrane subunit [Candidatus Oleimmundimicrobium sp.]|uniref:proton-conducting transporter transmembrane domain-containing protein n=1 Tax=Candidatus Oleimmundimicrobium sp. TaxID=3060597 RepID=UPI0027180564|nr:proton-conducting transporter membrane subunit [Candidatus Oleimmundimicrobium sp.]MDO8885890.1 proton-conducting transporter membrane subunit [Candidatus Oleimmundimicrobium sp.]
MNYLEVVMPLTSAVSGVAVLPFLACLTPIIGALVTGLVGKSEKLRNAAAVVTTFVTFVLVLAMYGPVVNGVHIGEHFYKGIEFSIKGILGASFKVDPVSLIVALVTSFLWFLCSIYAISYMSHEHARTRFAIFSLLTLGVDLGVLLTKDFFSLFVFFELLGFFSTMLVIHEEDKKALDAGKLYLWFCVIFGLVLLTGIVLLFAYTGTVDIKPMAELLEKTVPAYMRYLITTLMIMGFGAKAGVFFLHVWLPEAHPVAPTPASALLSGVMIKAGAYGILRSVNTLYAPMATKVSNATVIHTAAQWTTKTGLGYALIWLGVITMFFGVVNALLSHNCKRMLAYHSVSQMGYIIFGLGCAAYLGAEGAMGMAGGLYHIVNHALFKASLFLCVGAVYFRTRELDMYKLGGLWRNMPFVAVACLIAVFGISGIPGFNGFASKTLLHHSIFEAWEYSAVFSPIHQRDSFLLIAEGFFMLTAFGTFCSNFKMWLFVFIWKQPERFKEVKPEPISMRIVLVILSAVIIFIGLRPNWMLEKFIGPALAYFGYDAGSHAYHLLYNVHITEGIRSTIPLLYDPGTFSIFSNPEVLHNLLGGGMAVLGGGIYFVLGYRLGWFHVEVPEWTSVKYWYLKLATGFLVLPKKLGILKGQFRRRVATYLLTGEEERRREVVSNLENVLNEQKDRLEKLKAIKGAMSKLDRGATRLDRAELYRLRKVFRMIEEPLIRSGNLNKLDLDLLRSAVGIMEANPKQLSKEDIYWLRKLLLLSERTLIKEHKLGEEKLMRLQKTILKFQAVNRRVIQEELEKLHQKTASKSISLEELLSEEEKLRKAGLSSLNRLKGMAPKVEEISGSKIFPFEELQKGEERFHDISMLGMSKLSKLSSKAENIISEERMEPILQKALLEYKKAQLSYKIMTGSIFKEISNWIRRMILAMMVVLSEERFGGIEQAIYTSMDIEDTRNAIRSYTRDIGFNVLVLVGMLTLLSIMLLWGNI